ncbi:MAG: hypothetical protein R3351_02530 [Nitrospirales bacterium]|nr:hypothetical protein [Nitrospirales bacterium]
MRHIPGRSDFHPSVINLSSFSLILFFLLVVFSSVPFAAVIVLTGDAPTDFAEGNSVTDDGGLDVGTPPGWPFSFSGWDIQALYFNYDPESDTASFGLDFFGIAGDADGDGNPNASSQALMDRGGLDLPDLALTESIAILFDVNRDVDDGGDFDFVVGVPSQDSPNGTPLDCGVGADAFNLSNCFGLYDVDNDALQGVASGGQVFFARRPETVIPGPVPSAGSPDFEFAIPQWSLLLAKSGVAFEPCGPSSIDVRVFAGSFQDDGVGEDNVPNNASIATLNFSVPESALCSCREELDLCEENLDSNQTDSDGDGVLDLVDQCPQTDVAAGTDLLGCSQKQFCGTFSGRGLSSLRCALADWKNDEPLGARDCRMWRKTCLPR